MNITEKLRAINEIQPIGKEVWRSENWYIMYWCDDSLEICREEGCIIVESIIKGVSHYKSIGGVFKDFQFAISKRQIEEAQLDMISFATGKGWLNKEKLQV